MRLALRTESSALHRFLRRKPVGEALAKSLATPVSIDTRKAAVAEAALDALRKLS